MRIINNLDYVDITIIIGTERIYRSLDQIWGTSGKESSEGIIHKNWLLGDNMTKWGACSQNISEGFIILSYDDKPLAIKKYLPIPFS